MIRSVAMVSAFLVATAGLSPAHALAVETTVIITLADKAIIAIKALISQLFDDNRGAAAVAAVKSGSAEKKGASSWFGKAEALAAIGDDDGFAFAYAINSLGTKEVYASGEGTYASLAQIAWKGKIKDQYCEKSGIVFNCNQNIINPEGISAFGSLYGPLPDPSDVVSAEVRIAWELSSISVGQSPQGNSGVSLSIRDFAAIDEEGVFGDSLLFSGEFSQKIDYAAFFADPTLEFAVDGKAFTVASGVPEVGTWAMLLAGFGLVGIAARRQRRNFAA